MFSLKTKKFNIIDLIALAYPVLAAVAALQMLLRGPKIVNGISYTHYNNYLIFKAGAIHFWNQAIIYREWPELHWDMLKYSPAFCAWFGLIAWMPDWAGVMVWSLLNAVVLISAIVNIPKDFLTERSKLFLLLWLAPEAMTSFQNLQSNALIVGLVLWGWILAERGAWRYAGAPLLIASSIKIFAIVPMVIFFFYPERWRLVLSSIIWAFVLLFLPAVVVGFPYLIDAYLLWVNTLATDFDSVTLISVPGLLASFGLEIKKTLLVLGSAILLNLNIWQPGKWQSLTFRGKIVGLILLWVVLFNHRSESPTYVIAVLGACLYCFSNRLAFRYWHYIGLGCMLLLTILSPTDIFPKFIREEYVAPYRLKALGPFIIWLIATFELFPMLNKRNTIDKSR